LIDSIFSEFYFFLKKRKKKLVAENADPQTEARAAKIEKQAR